MRRHLQLAAVAGLLGLLLSTPAGAEPRDISRDTLAADDGWAAAGGGTTGGSTADAAHVFTYNAYNSGSERDLTADVGWTPTLHGEIDSARQADREVARGAGTGRIR